MYLWQQKHNYEEKWDTIEESKDLWYLVQQVRKAKTHVSHSGLCTHILQQRIIDESGKSYSYFLSEYECKELIK